MPRTGLRAAALVLALLAPHASHAAVFTTRDAALAAAFPGAAIERQPIVLVERQAKAIQRRAGARLASRVIGAYVATRGDTLLGVAFLDTRTVRTMPGVFMTVIAPDSTVARVEVLAFHEPPDYLPPSRWLGQFDSRPLSTGLRPKRDIRNISGATLTARSIAESVRLSLAIYEIVIAPTLAREKSR